MSLTLLFRWQLHIVAIDIAEICIRISGSAKDFVFKLYGACRKNVFNAMDYAITVRLKGVAEKFVFGTDATSQIPLQAVIEMLSAKPEEFCHRAPGICMLLQQNAIGAAVSSYNAFAEGLRNTRIWH